MTPRPAPHDIVIMGGGLAGLTLALQLKQRFADLDVTVLERRTHPVPHAAHKVGESSVEIGAHYFDTVLGLKPHLQGEQLRKFGFRFFFSEGRRDIAQVTEIGASRYLSVPSYQIDRGIFENYLAAEAVRRGVRFIDGATVRRIELADGPHEPPGRPEGEYQSAAARRHSSEPHRLEWSREGAAPQTLEARWLIDACGRAGMLKRKLGLAEANGHDCHAVWFRIEDRLCIDDWSDDPAWRARCEPRARWLSTNHLVGAGYWVWLIPLASGSHSVGIVADPKLHPLEGMDSFDKAMDWLARWQPRLFDELDQRRHLLQDFSFLRRFSYGCKQVFSAQRWAITGEAGLFLDPFYSPGSDFIALGNTYICDLVAHDRAGHSMEARARLYDQLFHSFYESTLALYQGQYALFGDPEVLPAKVLWDYSYYWGVLSQIFFHERLTDLALLGSLRGELEHCQRLNFAMQRFFRAWSARSDRRNRPLMHDQAALPWFAELNRSLNDRLDDAAFSRRLRDSARLLDRLSAEIVDQARAGHPALQREGDWPQPLNAAGGQFQAAGGAAPMLFETTGGAPP